MSAATPGTKLLTNELTKKMRRTTGKGGREPGVSAARRFDPAERHQRAVGEHERDGEANPPEVGSRARVEDSDGSAW